LVPDPSLWVFALIQCFSGGSNQTASFGSKKKKKSEVNTSSYPPQRFLADVVITLLLILLVTLLHMTTVFDHLYPAGLYTLATITSILGFIAHYLIPTLRKPYPFNFFRSPILESAEYKTFDPANKPSQRMWFEIAFLVITTVEKLILYPVILLIAATEAAEHLHSQYGLLYHFPFLF
jgi:hypothetical protein